MARSKPIYDLNLGFFGFPTNLAAVPLSRGGKPVCWVNIRPFTGDATADVLVTTVEFLRRALW
jgi:hypothetical protein